MAEAFAPAFRDILQRGSLQGWQISRVKLAGHLDLSVSVRHSGRLSGPLGIAVALQPRSGEWIT
jgi:hypothetical protein